MMGFKKSYVVTGVVAISLCAMVANSKVAKVKRDSDSLYENIYSAIADFTDETNNQQQQHHQDLQDLPVQKRQVAQARSGSIRTGRQTQTRQVIVDGFPSGLPDGTPEGVKIALASMQNLPPGEMPPIPGEAGVDFPVFASVPQTSFDCDAQTFPGIYADTEADCQVFFMCQPNGNFNSFLCPNGTVFNQQYFICDWWYNFDCSAAPSFYGLNEFIYQDQPQDNNDY